MSFNLARFTNLWSFYHPRMMRFWLFAGAAILVGYLGLAFNVLTGNLFLYTLFSALVSYPILGAPIVFALGRDRALELQLPASPLERLAVMALFCFVVVPIGLSLLWYIFEIIGSGFGVPKDLNIVASKLYLTPSEQEVAGIDSLLSEHANMAIYSTLANLTPLATGLFAAMIARRSPVLTTIGGLIVGYVLLCLFAGVGGVVFAVIDIWDDPDQIVETFGPDKINVPFVLDMVKTVIELMAFFGLFMAVVLLPLMYRKIKRAQL